MRIISKKEAIESGYQYYFTGKPCKRGHLEKRPVKTGVCLECLRIASKNHYDANKDKVLSRQAKYRAENQDKVRESFKKHYDANKESRSNAYKGYRERNKEKERERHKKYLEENKDKILARQKAYRDLNKEKIRAKHANRRAKLKSAEGKHTEKDIKRILSMQNNCCAGCKCKLGDYHVDHITPISKGVSNWPSNLQILCQKCNLNKHAKDPIDWASERGFLL